MEAAMDQKRIDLAHMHMNLQVVGRQENSGGYDSWE